MLTDDFHFGVPASREGLGRRGPGGARMTTLRLLDAEPGPDRQGADLYSCSYTSDGRFVLSAGWDGFLRLWDAPTGAEVSALQVGRKPLSACAISPDGRQWLAGSIEGLLTIHDAETRELVSGLTAHTRPISAIRYGPDGESVATASWDRLVVLRKLGKEREARTMTGHKDIVAGCRFTGDGGRLLSWSYDHTLRLWELASGRDVSVLNGHEDRVTAAAPSPDGRWAVSGGRDGAVHLWDLSSGASARFVQRRAEARAVYFLPDGASAVLVDAAGAVALLSTADLTVQSEVQTGTKPLCADLSASGMELVLGGEDGRVRFLTVEGLEDSALVVTAGRRSRESRGVLHRLLGRPRLSYVYECTCPVCRRAVESAHLPTEPFRCPGCGRALRVSGAVRELQEA